MKTLADRWIAWWLAVPKGDTARRRRGRLLAIILAAALAGLVILTIADVGMWLSAGLAEQREYVLIDLLALVLCLALWWLNRIGRTLFAGYAFVILAILASSVGFDPRLIDRSMILYAVPILAASFVIIPRCSFLAALLATLGYTSAYLRGDGALEYNYAAVIGLYVLALLAWLAAHTLERQIAELDQTESRYRTTLHSIGDAVIATDAEGRVTLANPVAEALIGWPLEEARGRPLIEVFDIVNEQTRLPGENPVARVLREGAVVGLANHTLLLARDGAKHPIADSGAPIRNERGDITGVVLVFRDQTAERAAQEALRASQERFRVLVENAHDIVYTLSSDGRFQYISPHWTVQLGYTVDEAIGHLFEEFVHPDDLPRLRAALAAGLASGQISRRVGEYRVRAKSGAWQWHVSDGSILRDADGNPTAYLGIARDITERKLAEQALHESETRYRALLDNAPVGIAVHSDGQIVFTNLAGARLLGADAEEQVIGRPIRDIIHPDGLAAALARVQRLLAGEQGLYPAEDVYVRLDGSLVNVQVMATLLTYRGRPAVQVIVTDITERKRIEQALRESETRYRQLAESTDAIWWEHDMLADRFTYLAPQVERVLGYRPEEWIGSEFWAEHIHPDDRERTRRHASECIAAGQPHDLEYRFRRKDGEYVWLRDIMSPELRDGRTVIVRGFMLDVTERRQAEEAVRQREQEMARLMDNLPGFVYRCANDREWTMEYISDGFRNVTGYDPGDLLDNNKFSYNDLIPPDHREPLWMRWQEVLRHEGIFEAEYPIIHANGSTRWVWERGRGIFDERGQLLFLEGFITDVTARRQAEGALRRERELLRMVLDHVPDPIYVKDAQARKTLTNRADVENLGLESETDVLGKTDMEIFMPEFGARYYADDLSVLAGTPIIDHENMSVTLNGRRRWMLTSKLPLRDDQGQIIGLVGVSHNITALKEAQEERERLQTQLIQAQKMEAVGRLAGGVAHDFNNMLSVILGHAELGLLQLDASDALHADLTEIQKAAQRSADLTRQLLAFARRQTVTPRVLDLNDIVVGMLRMLRRLIGEEIDLAWLPAANLWSIRIDPSQVDQILANLCINARDAISGTGKVTIETHNATVGEDYVASHPDAAPGEYVMLAVTDTGSGMEPDVLEHLFEPFFTTKPVGQGTGLGLSTVYGIVKQNQGFVNVYSEAGQGATFHIYLPRAIAPAATSEAAPQVEAQRGHGETVLLVEDEPAILRMGKLMLERLGYTVLAASTPAQALQLGEDRSHQIRLLITDVVMPEMDGRTLAEQLRAIQPDLKCLFMSGYTADVIAHQGVLDEGVQFLPKPFTPGELGAKVRQALQAL